jgi:type IV pilus assembly protein PilN
MTRINLLDWRAERREQRRREFTSMLGLAAVAAAVVVFVAYMAMQNAVDYQKERNKLLQDTIADIDKQIKEIEDLQKTRDSLISRMKIIERLQQSRSGTVHFFDELVNTLPDGVYLTHVKQEGQEVTIEGVAESNGRISAYMKNLDASPWFDDPQLVIIRTGEKDKQRSSQFTLKVKNLTNSTDGKKKAGGAGDSP